jgi:hypothetical protein
MSTLNTESTYRGTYKNHKDIAKDSNQMSVT